MAQERNPYYVQPATPDLSGLMSGIGSMVERTREAQKTKEAQTFAGEALQSGDPKRIADAALKYPQLSQAMQASFGFTNDATKKISTDAYRRALSDPENAASYIQQGIQEVTEAGGRPDMMARDAQMLQENPQAALKAMAAGYAGVDPEGYNVLFGTGKAAMKERELAIKEKGLSIREEEAAMRKDEQALKTESNELKRDELELKIQQRREKIEADKEEIQTAAKAQVRQQTSLSDAIDEFKGNKKYVSAMTGYRGRTPAVTTTGLEAQAYFDNIKNNLTLENLDKMTGVLSETDIKILSGAATALMPGMSQKAMFSELDKIQNVLKDKSQDVQDRLLGKGQDQAQPEANQDTQALEWARANPNDPRAQQILQMQGGQ